MLVSTIFVPAPKDLGGIFHIYGRSQKRTNRENNPFQHTSIEMVVQHFLLTVSTFGLEEPSLGQVAVVDVSPATKTKPFDVDAAYGYQANTDLKKASGDFHRNAFRIALKCRDHPQRQIKMDNILFYANHNYTFSGNSAFQ